MNEFLEVGDVFELKKDEFVYIDGGDKICVGEENSGDYVVVDVKMDGGGYGHGPGDYYPDGFHVYAQKLKDGEYDPDGLKITFYQSGCFTIVKPYVDVKKRMKKVITFVDI